MTVQLSRSTFEALRDAVEDDSGASLRPNYSGRAMYGALCLALVCDRATELVQFVLLLPRLRDEYHEHGVVTELDALIVELEAGRTSTQQDSLGHDVVYYWPGVAVAR